MLSGVVMLIVLARSLVDNVVDVSIDAVEQNVLIPSARPATSSSPSIFLEQMRLLSALWSVAVVGV